MKPLFLYINEFLLKPEGNGSLHHFRSLSLKISFVVRFKKVSKHLEHFLFNYSGFASSVSLLYLFSNNIKLKVKRILKSLLVSKYLMWFYKENILDMNHILHFIYQKFYKNFKEIFLAVKIWKYFWLFLNRNHLLIF